MNKFKDLLVWQKAMDLAKNIYEITSDFPSEEKFGLTSQIKRSAISIPSNIAEGAGRNAKNEFKHFLSIAQGSSFELETQLILAEKLSFISKNKTEVVLESLQEIQKMISGLQKTLN